MHNVKKKFLCKIKKGGWVGLFGKSEHLAVKIIGKYLKVTRDLHNN